MAESNRYAWFSKYRKEILPRLEKAQNNRKVEDTKTVKSLKKKIANLQIKINKLYDEKTKICPHPNESIIYNEIGHQDDYGCWTEYMSYSLKCELCGWTLDEWDNTKEVEENRFKNSNNRWM